MRGHLRPSPKPYKYKISHSRWLSSLAPPYNPPPNVVKNFILVNCDKLSQDVLIMESLMEQLMSLLTAPVIAICALVLCNFTAFMLLLRAGTRLANLERALVDLDWEALANLVGDVSTLKRTIQKLNLRLNGMETADPMAVLNRLPNLQPNVTAIGQNKNNGG